MIINRYNKFYAPADENVAPAAERTNNALEDLFRDTPVEDVVEETTEDEIPEDFVEALEEVEETETTEESTEEVDYDAPPTESKAVEQAKIRGKEAKELKAKLTERELELDKIQKDYEATRARLEEIEATKIAGPIMSMFASVTTSRMF